MSTELTAESETYEEPSLRDIREMLADVQISVKNYY